MDHPTYDHSLALFPQNLLATTPNSKCLNHKMVYLSGNLEMVHVLAAPQNSLQMVATSNLNSPLEGHTFFAWTLYVFTSARSPAIVHTPLPTLMSFWHITSLV